MPQAGSFNFEVASNFMPPVRHGASGASMWVMATNPDFGPHSPYGGCAGCLGSIIVNNSATYTKTNDYYMIGQFSRFIRRGAVNHKVLQGVEGSAMTTAQFDIITAQNPDMGWAVVFMNNFGSDQDVRLSFTDGGFEWQGTIPNGTVTTWLLPSDQIVYQQASHWQSSLVGSNSSLSALAGSLVSASSVCPTTSSMASSSSSSTLEPVPYTTHSIAANNEYQGID